MADTEKVFYDKKIFRLQKDAPLKDAILVITGNLKGVNKRTNDQGKAYLSMDVECSIGDKFVKDNFGEDYVNPEHKVLFQFTLNSWRAEEFEKYPPRWGQNMIFLFTNMEPKVYRRKDGQTVYYISCFGDTMSVGSVKKPVGILNRDGTTIAFDENTRFAYAERTAVKIFSQDSRHGPEDSEQEQETMTQASCQIQEMDLLELDEDDPF